MRIIHRIQFQKDVKKGINREAHLAHLESTAYVFSSFLLSLEFTKLLSPFP